VCHNRASGWLLGLHRQPVYQNRAHFDLVPEAIEMGRDAVHGNLQIDEQWLGNIAVLIQLCERLTGKITASVPWFRHVSGQVATYSPLVASVPLHLSWGLQF
jgi:hypothetical protein